MFTSIVLILLSVLLGFHPAYATGSPKSWHRYLQFTSEKPNDSLISVKKFFLHPDGFKNPELELQESIKLFREGKFICDYPARKALIEKITGEKFPNQDCPLVDRWRKAFGGEKIWIIFAGTYFNNPASLFGHTFLRFDKKSEQDSAQSLRSQSVGFLADTPQTDSQTSTVFKGLFGFYTGYYNVQPYYMQTALYNNSESRSLWEYELNLTAEEKQWAIDYLWELSERAGMPYWFADENCSFQIMAFLEAVRPNLNLTKESGVFVLPLETVRVLEKNKMLTENFAYQPSIRTKWKAMLSQMSADERAQYRKARHDLKALEETNNIKVLDALTEYQTFFNYQKKANLNAEQRKIFELTFSKRAQLGKSEPVTVKTPINPLKSHQPAYLQLTGQNHHGISAAGLMGAHDLISSQDGIEDASTIEYIGFEVDHNTKTSKIESAEILLGRVRALNNLSLEEPKFSWGADGFVKQARNEKNKWQTYLLTSVSGGFAFITESKDWMFSLMGQGRLLRQGTAAAGPTAMIRHENRYFVIAAEHSQMLISKYYFRETSVQFMPKWNQHWAFILSAEIVNDLNDRYGLSFRRYF